MNAELERLRPMPERLNDAIRFLDALILNRRFSRVEYEGLAGARGILRDLLCGIEHPERIAAAIRAAEEASR